MSTIDNFQGEEARIVIVSLTRSNAAGKIGFLSEAQRVNVLLSRARDGLILVGNPRCLTGKHGALTETGGTLVLHAGPTMIERMTVTESTLHYPEAASGDTARRGGGRKGTWEMVLESIPVLPGFPAQCERHGRARVMAAPAEFDEYAPDGGCTERCEAELPCGHKCTSRCHSTRHAHAACQVPVDCMCDPQSSSTLPP